jgi:hypothetical protein
MPVCITTFCKKEE